MGDVVDIEQWKRKRLDTLVCQWEQYMARASDLQKEGKLTFAKEMTKKAAELRPEIDRLRKALAKKAPPPPAVTPTARPWGSPMMNTFGFSADMGYPKTPQVTPAPENN